MNPNDFPEYLPSDTDRAFAIEEEDACRLYYLNTPQAPVVATPASTHTSYLHPQQWTPTFQQQSTLLQPPANPYVVPSSSFTTESWPQQPWQSLHPDDWGGTVQGPISDTSRSTSPNNPADLANFGHPLGDGRTWRCAYPGCTSASVFTRGCDLRKHFRRHTKSLFCRHEDCPQATEGGFSSKKDRDRHEAKHKPGVACEWDGCERVFSRVDNMKDHVRRIHRKASG